MIQRLAITLAALTLMIGPIAQAKSMTFTATLSGDKMPTMTGSKATGQALIVVDADKQTLDMTLDVAGLTPADLWKQLVLAPVGPIHLHRYASQDHSDPGSSVLLLPFPYGQSYTATKTGFRLELKSLPYARAAAVLKSTTSFEAFVSVLQNRQAVLNIHTNAQTDGEISGEVVPVGG